MHEGVLAGAQKVGFGAPRLLRLLLLVGGGAGSVSARTLLCRTPGVCAARACKLGMFRVYASACPAVLACDPLIDLRL